MLFLLRSQPGTRNPHSSRTMVMECHNHSMVILHQDTIFTHFIHCTLLNPFMHNHARIVDQINLKQYAKKYLSRHHNSRHGMPWKILPPLAVFFSHIVIMLSQQLTAVSTSSRCCSFRQARDCSSFKSDRDNCKPARGDIMSCAAWATVSTDDDVGARGSSCCCC